MSNVDFDDELPTLERILFPRGRVHEATAQSIRYSDSTSSYLFDQQIPLIDLTEDAEHCTTCETQLINNLDNKDSYIYVFSACGCVSLPVILIGRN